MGDSQNRIFDIIESRWDGVRKIERLRKDDDTYKVMDEVFDYDTLRSLYQLISKEIIYTVNYPLSTGKEAKLFKGTSPDGSPLVVKVHRISTATVKSFRPYLDGDPRFVHYKKDHRSMIFTWTQKEYKNLQRLEDAGVFVPSPVRYLKNILVMGYMGSEETAAPMLKDTQLEDPETFFSAVLEGLSIMVNRANMVHGDLSEYNILVTDDGPCFIDVAQSVLLSHPAADMYLKRDVHNLCRYFKRLGVQSDEDQVLARIRKTDD